MNRWDEIQAAARDIASNVHADEHARNAMADDLIRLCGLMIGAVGKGVAIDGESSMNDAHHAPFRYDPEDDGDEAAQRAAFDLEQSLEVSQAHGMYVTGERIQDGARDAVAESVGADLERYAHGSYGSPVWTHTDRRPATLRVNVPCTGSPDTCPRPVAVSPADGHFGCIRCACPRPDTLEQQAADFSHPGQPHTRVTALDEMDQPLRDEAGKTWYHCGVCGVLLP